MSESKHTHDETSVPSGKWTWVQLGGSLGIAGATIGLLIFLAGCFGFSKAFALSILPLALGVISTVLVVLGSTVHKSPADGEMEPMSAVFPSLLSLIGGVLLFTAWMGWLKLPGAAA